MVLGIAVYVILFIRKREASRNESKALTQTPWSGEKEDSWIPLMEPPAGPMKYYVRALIWKSVGWSVTDFL